MNAVPIDPSATVDSLVHDEGGPPRSSAEGSSRLCGVYGIWCEANEKWYVGQSISIIERWKQHLRDLRRGTHHCRPLQSSWNKYGEATFLWVVLARCPAEELEAHEQEETGALTAMAPTGFVLIAGGKIRTISTATREKLSKALRGSNHPQWGKPLTQRQRAAISKARRGRSPSAEARAARHKTNLIARAEWRSANGLRDDELKCRFCGRVGCLNEFRKQVGALDGRLTTCKNCFNKWRAKWRARRKTK